MAAKKKPSKKISTRALTGQRTLGADIPSYNSLYDAVALNFPSAGQGGWYNEGLPNAIAFEVDLDLAGYTLDDLTFVPTGGMCQDPGRFVAENMPDVDIEVLDIISQERLSLTEVEANLFAGILPGSIGSSIDHKQIMFGAYRVMSTNTNYVSLDICTTMSAGSFGSAEPSAAARLWVYKIIRINGAKTAASDLRIPASRFILPGVVIKETELSYMQRLKRSYELAQ